MTLVVSLVTAGLVCAENETSEVIESTQEVEKSDEAKKTEEIKKTEDADKPKAETKSDEEGAVVEKTDEMEQPKTKVLTEKEAEAAEEAEDKKNTEGVESVERQVLGWKEWVNIGTKADKMRAKLDSGARTSSLHAEGEEEFERDGRKWVRFSIRDPDKTNTKSILIKAPVQRVARIKNADGSIDKRFVVELGFTIGDRQLREDFTLNDRSDMICPILIGRNALRHLGYVDCSRVDLAGKNIVK